MFVVSYNTDNVSAAELPDSIEGFADPKWKGRISMEVEDLDWFATLQQHMVSEGMTEQEANDLFRKIAANAKVVKGHTVQAELLAAGQFDVALSTYSHSVEELEQEGAPVTWRTAGEEPIQPLVTRPNGIGLMRTATNPAAATLFADFELKEGQEVFAEEYRIGAIPTEGDPLAGWRPSRSRRGRSWPRTRSGASSTRTWSRAARWSRPRTDPSLHPLPLRI